MKCKKVFRMLLRLSPASETTKDARLQRLAAISVLMLTLCALASQVAAVPHGQIAYAVNGFDENLGRFDWNLYRTTLKGTNESTAVALNRTQPGARKASCSISCNGMQAPQMSIRLTQKILKIKSELRKFLAPIGF